MATLAELNTLITDPTLSEKVGAALLVAAKDVTFEDAGTANHANRLKWAKKVLSDPVGERVKMMRFVLGVKSSDAVAAIQGLSDTDIKDNVALGINVFADGS